MKPTNKQMRDLHIEMVNLCVQFMRDNNITDIDELHLSADGLIHSVNFGEWHPGTDSALVLKSLQKEEFYSM